MPTTRVRSVQELVVGVVTVTFNSADVIGEFLTSLAAQQGVKIRLYVIDNQSTDDTSAQVRADAPQGSVLIENDHNAGFAAGSNQGIELAMADGVDFVLLLNNDTSFGPDLLASLVRTAVDAELDLVTPLVLAHEPPDTIWYGGGSLSKVALVARHKREGRPRSEAPSTLERQVFGSACCLLVRPAVFRRVGMFDPVYFVYFDDVDLAVRANRAGFTYWLDPTAVLVHKASALTGGKRSTFTLTWTSRNWPLMVRRHQRGWRLLLGLGFIQAWIVGRFLLRRDDARLLLLRERQFRAAMSISLAQAVPFPRADGLLARPD